MALTQCKECGKEVSTKAAACPHCGASTKRNTVGCGGAILVVLLGFIVYAIFSPPASPPPTPVATQDVSPPKPLKPGDEVPSGARGMCLLSIKKVLHDPGSADFTRTTEWHASVRKDGTILVQPQLRAKNAMGALVFSTWNCVVRQVTGGWTLVSLKQIGP